METATTTAQSSGPGRDLRPSVVTENGHLPSGTRFRETAYCHVSLNYKRTDRTEQAEQRNCGKTTYKRG